MKHVALLVLLVLIGVSISADEEVKITFPYSVPGMSRHGNVLVVVHYREDSRNRLIDLVWESIDGESGGSGVEITPENNGIPIAKDLILSAGEYVFTALLYRSDGSKIVTTETRVVTR